MNRLKFSILTILSFVLVMLSSAPISTYAASSSGNYLTLTGLNDSDNCTVAVTYNYSLYSTRYSRYVEPYTDSCYIGGSGSYSKSSGGTSYTYYTEDVNYRYIINTSYGSFYVDSLGSNYSFPGMLVSVTCIAEISIKSSPTAPDSMEGYYNYTVNFNPSISVSSIHEMSDDEILENIDGNAELIVSTVTDIQDTVNDVDETVTTIQEDVETINEKLDELMLKNMSSTLGNGYDILTFGADTCVKFTYPDDLYYVDAGSYINISSSVASGYSPYLSFQTSDLTLYDGAVPIGYQSPGSYLAIFGAVTSELLDTSALYSRVVLYSNGEFLCIEKPSLYVSYSYYDSLYYYIFCIPCDLSYYFDSIRVSVGGFYNNFNMVSFILAKDNGTIEDLMNYLDQKWSSSYTVAPDVSNAQQTTDDALSSVDSAEQEYFTQYDEAYENAGVADFDLSVLANQFSFLSSIVEGIWSGMPATLQFLIYATLVVGVIGLIISASGRIARKVKAGGE